MITFRDIQKARTVIGAYVHKTPLIYSNTFSKLTGAEVYLKVENLQKTGSFKVRGAFSKMCSIGDGPVIAASMGNHAQGVAFAASRLEKHAQIIMPLTASIVKQEATRGYGADVVLFGESFNDALAYALSRKDYIFIHAFDDDAIIAGQGTVGIEIIEDLEDIDDILVPVGGGGLIAGIAAAVKERSPATKVIGVQTGAAASAHISFRKKKIHTKLPSTTLADGIAVGRVGERTFEIMKRYVDDMLLVDEDSIAMSILLFLERKKLVVEGAGAVTLAALIGNRETFQGKRVVLVVSGGNIDFALIDRIIHKGLITSGRIGVFDVTVEDIPGRLSVLTGIIAGHRGNILNIIHDRLVVDLPIGKTRVIFTVETRGKKHLKEILADMKRKGFEVRKK